MPEKFLIEVREGFFFDAYYDRFHIALALCKENKTLYNGGEKLSGVKKKSWKLL